jgi:hypothetical protein
MQNSVMYSALPIIINHLFASSFYSVFICTVTSITINFLLLKINIIILRGASGSVVVKTLCYKLEGRGLDT